MSRFCACLLVSISVAAGSLLAAARGFYFPSEGQWEGVKDVAAVADVDRLERALAFARRNNSGGVVVLWRGRILAERYWNGWDEETTHSAYSVSKCYVSTLIGMAIEEGSIDGVGQSAADFLPEWRGSPPHEAITIGDLLSMTSGLEGGKRVFMRGLMARDERGFATGLEVEHRPGTYWEYHNSAYRLLFSILEEATGESLPEYTERKLLRPLGMRATEWEAKRRLSRDTQYTYLKTTARDAARYGLLVLAGGEWDRRRLVSAERIERSTRPAHPAVHPSYGYLWWLNGGDFHYLPLNPRRQKGPIFPGVPADAFAALGKDDQKIYVVPSLELVVARFGEAADSSAPAISEFDAEFLGRICRSLTGKGR
jgi:CubicO group peptidase (beta-lactamase class C family)